MSKSQMKKLLKEQQSPRRSAPKAEAKAAGRGGGQLID